MADFFINLMLKQAGEKMPMSKIKNTLADIFIVAAMLGTPIAGGVVGARLYEQYAEPIVVPQTISELPQVICGPYSGLKIPQERLETELAAIQSNPEAYKEIVRQGQKVLAATIGCGLTASVLALVILAGAERKRRPSDPQP
jgi:hypothetical protein